MKTNSHPQRLSQRPRWLPAFAGGFTFLLASAGLVYGSYTAVPNTTFLNAYFNDGTPATIAPSISPYAPNQQCVNSGGYPPGGVGLPLLGYGSGAWLQTGLPTPAPFPGAVSGAVWSSGAWSAANANAQISYDQASYWVGSNAVSTTFPSPVGTLLVLNNFNHTGVAELRLDWTTTYTYAGPAVPAYANGTSHALGDVATDSNHNQEVCTTAGASNGSQPNWPATRSAAFGTTTADGSAVWTLIPNYMPGNLTVDISGTVNSAPHSFSAVTGAETFSDVNSATTETAQIPPGGNFPTPASVAANPFLGPFVDGLVDTSAYNYIYGYENPPWLPANTFNSSASGNVATSMNILDGDTVIVNGFLDMFVDPGSLQAQIVAPQLTQSYSISFSNSATLLIADQLEQAGGNSFTNVFGNQLPDYSEVLLWNCCSESPAVAMLAAGGCYTVYYADSSSPSGWDDANLNPISLSDIASITLWPGQGAFVIPNGPCTLTFTGTTIVPILPAPLPCGCGQWNLLSCQTNGIGTYQNVTGLAPVQGSQVLRWDASSQSFVTYTFSRGVWAPNAPNLNIGEAAFFLVPCSTTPTNCVNVECPTNIFVTSCTNVPVYYAPIVTDTCCSNWTLTCTPPSGSYFVPGTTNTVFCTAVDWCGMSNNCSFTVTVLPDSSCNTNCLSLQCPANIIETTCSNCAIVNFAANATDLCCTNAGASGTSSGVVLSYSPPSGSCFPLGLTTVTVTASDACNVATCSFTVSVLPCGVTNCIDLLCPPTIMATACGSKCAVVNFAASATDFCCTNPVTLNYSQASGSCFPLGTNVVAVTATDSCGNSASGSFLVIVTQSTGAPVFLTGPTNVTLCQGLQASGTVIVDSDEWDNSDTGFSYEGDGMVYATNCANYLTGNKSHGTNILICSDDFSLSESDLPAALTAAGYHVTHTVPPLTNSLSGYNAVYVGGDVFTTAELAELQTFICDGGGVYIAAGTGAIPGGAAGEAAQWNGLLNGFGLNLASNYDLVEATLVAPSTLTVSGPLMTGVTTIFNDNGNNVNVIAGYPLAQVVAAYGAQGLIGVSGCTATMGCGCGIMPNLTSQVTVSGGGTVTQSIPPGTLVCTNTYVTLTATNTCGAATNLIVPVILVNCVGTNSCPVTNSILLNTGYNQNSNTVYALGSADAFWTVTGQPPTAGGTVPRPATVVAPNPAWLPAMPNSQWISSYPSDADNLDGEYDFETYFCLECGATNLVLNVCLRADDVATASLNGHPFLMTPPIYSFRLGASCATVTSALNPTWFLPGQQNVLHVSVTNLYGVAMGLNVSATLTGSGASIGNPACCLPTSGISGQKYFDLNGSGVRTAGDPPLPGWTIQINGPSGTYTTQTDANGYYYFQGLPAGTYTLTEVPQAGWTQTAPAGGSYTVTLGLAQQVNGKDFGNKSNTNACNINITCPSNQVAYCTGGGAAVSYSASATSTCTNTPVMIYYSWPSGTFFPVGVTTVYCTAWNTLGGNASCSFTVTVLDTNAPVFSVLTNKTVGCGANWSFDTPEVSDPCGCTNFIVRALAPVTNGVCPQLITETWIATNLCNGLWATVSQTVTNICCTTSNCLSVQCPSNKVVQCGTAWTFDTPTATSCCTNLVGTGTGTSANVQVISISKVTNGVCPQIITNIWLIYDGCGNTDLCSQVVTVVDTTPPMISCPTNAVIVALTTNCEMIIPAVSVSATDNCTPLCSLIYSQSPTNGTIVSGTSAYVTVTVTDLCGNSSQCRVLVEGINKRGLVVTWPKSLTTSNCSVPCVSNYLTISDCSCKPSEARVTQSPPCDAPVGPGLNSITVTVTDCNGNVATKVIPLTVLGTESFLGKLFNTGVNGSGSLLADDAVDSHYALPLANVPASLPGAVGDYHDNAVAVSDICHGSAPNYCAWHDTYVSYTCYEFVPWSLPPDWAHFAPAVSKWIAPDYTNNGCCPAGAYKYVLSFNLPAGTDPATATISGRWAADDSAGLALNGTAVPVNSPVINAWTPFTIPAGSSFQSGNNTLTFLVTNAGFFTGLRVEFTNAFACSTCAPPAIVSMTSSETLPVGSAATFNVKASGTPPISYQWTFNGSRIAGANSPTLHRGPLSFANAGLYSVIIANPCGVVTGYLTLHVTYQLPWTNAWWNVQDLSSPLAATFGPDLMLTGSSLGASYALNVGTTEDFGLANPGGQIVNVMDINPQAGATFAVPAIIPAGSSSDDSYTVIMDLYEPDTSAGTPSTLFASLPCCVGSSGHDGVELTLDQTNNLHLTGSVGGVPFDAVSAAPLPVDTWNRLALVVDVPTDGGSVSISGYLNGDTAVAYVNPCPCCNFIAAGPTLNWNIGVPQVLTTPTNVSTANAEFYVSSIQFHAVAMSPQMIAGIGSPDTGPAPANDTSVPAPAPALSATVANGSVTFSWAGSPYVLQETTDLSSGNWVDSSLPLVEATANGTVSTTVTVSPTVSAPAKFYRLVFRP